MKVLVTGANGQLGRDVVKFFTEYHEVYGYGRDRLDITNEENTNAVVHGVRPDVIVHCAAYTAVDKAEQEKDRAYLVNATGSSYVARAAADVGAKVCAISTDYVFDGQAREPYVEDASTNPQSVYGASKLAGEKLIRENIDAHFIIRTSWVFGVHGNNFVKTMLRLASQGQAIKVVNDQIGAPTYTKDLAALLLKLVESDKFGIYHASNAGACSWYEFAQEIFRQSRLSVDLTPCSTKEFPRPAQRPAYSVFQHGKLQENGFPVLQSWQDALRDFLQDFSNVRRLEV